MNQTVSTITSKMTITVAALGVRLVALDQTNEDSNMVNKHNPADAEGYTWPVILKHEGTEQQSVKPHLSQAQSPHPFRDDVLLPTEDDWSGALTFRAFYSVSNGARGDQLPEHHNE